MLAALSRWETKEEDSMTLIITPRIEIAYDVGVVWPDGSIEWPEPSPEKDGGLYLVKAGERSYWRRIGNKERGVAGLGDRDEFPSLVKDWTALALANRQPVSIIPERIVRQRVTVIGVGVVVNERQEQEARLTDHLLVADPHDTADSAHPLAQAARLMGEAFAERSQS